MLVRQHLAAKKAQVDAHLGNLWQGVQRAYDRNWHACQKSERYALKSCQLLRQLTDLEVKERQMFELDNRKDQIMTTLRLALTNLAMWTRDNFFPADYAHATWKRLAPFFYCIGIYKTGGDKKSCNKRQVMSN